MTQQNIGLGTVANDGTGDSLRDAGGKINDNFTELYGRTPVPIGGGAGQILSKASSADGDVTWIDAPSGGGGGGSSETRNRNISFRPPTIAQFTDTSVYGRGSSSTPLSATDDAANGLLLTDPTSDSTGFKTLLRDIPGSPTSFEIAAKVNVVRIGARDYLLGGVCLVDASSKVQIWGLMVVSNILCWTDDYWDGAWHDTHYTEFTNDQPWLKLGFDASGNLHFHTSLDGYNWPEIYPGSTLSGRGFSTPTKYGFVMHRYTNGTGLMTVPWFFSTEFSAPATAPLA